MNLLNKIAVPLTALTISIGCSHYRVNYIELPKDIGRLYASKRSFDLHYYIERSRTIGEKDLVELAAIKNKYEEAWLFVHYKTGKEIWFEYGIFESQGQVDDQSFLEETINKIRDGDWRINDVSCYHYHSAALGKTDSSQLPSDSDILASWSKLKFISENTKSLLDKVDFRVAVSTGVYIITFDKEILNNPKVVDRLKKTHLFSRAIEELDYNYSNKENFVKNNKKVCKEYNNWIYQVFKKEYVNLKFEER